MKRFFVICFFLCISVQGSVAIAGNFQSKIDRIISYNANAVIQTETPIPSPPGCAVNNDELLIPYDGEKSKIQIASIITAMTTDSPVIIWYSDSSCNNNISTVQYIGYLRNQ